jgi:crotonobetainyl-CoA:carnitine CoA-transferase CaiB-like acyl-CoA transferase
MATVSGGLLTGTRVLDLADSRAELAGRLLADFGAEVLKIEAPGGVDSRRKAPFDGRPGADGRSLYWAAVGLGKRSAVLDLDTPDGRQKLRELARRADILIESFEPGRMAKWDLDYGALSEINPRLIYVSVSPYGQKGPKALWPASDLTIEAAAGRVGLQGDRDRPPIPVGYPQASFHGGGQAAADAVIALNERELSGRGQHLDLSMQEAVIWTHMNGPGYPPNTGTDPPATGDDRATAELPPRLGPFMGVSACRDGFVVVTPTSQRQFLAAITASVLPALRDERLVPSELSEYDWGAWDSAREAGELTDEQMNAAALAGRTFFQSRDKLELMQWAWGADVHLGPVNSTADLIANPHFSERGFWQEAGGTVHPGLSVRSSRTPLRLGGPAPGLGQNQALMDEWLALPALEPDVPPVGAGQSERPGEAFAGLKVVDFSWVAVGPLTAKALADHGATVVKVESSTRIDYLRTLVPFKDGVVGVNRSHYYNNCNTSKLGAAINLKTPEGLALARRLADWADVVVENFTPGTMKRLGLDYETLSKDRPELIMVSTCLLGQTGPWASFAGYGPHGAAISGLHYLTGWPGRPPTGPSGPYSDVIAPRYSVSALAAAILEMRRTGKGQHLDVSQVESAVHFLEPLVLDQTVNGRTAPPAGLDSAWCCPHGVYATLGSSRYVALSCETPEQWRALRTVAPLDPFASDAYDTLGARMAVREKLDAAIAAWAAGFDPFDLERLLAEAGVPASVVMRMTDLHKDAQLAERGYFVPLKHSEVGVIPYDGLVTRFSAKKEVLHKAAPCLGEDTQYVMSEILGLSGDEIADLAAKEVFV